LDLPIFIFNSAGKDDFKEFNKKFRLSDYEEFFIPINLVKAHWFLIYIIEWYWMMKRQYIGEDDNDSYTKKRLENIIQRIQNRINNDIFWKLNDGTLFEETHESWEWAI